MTSRYHPYAKTSCSSECAYCFKTFPSQMKMQKHVLGEFCLPKDANERWIVKFLTIEARANPRTSLCELSDELDYLFETNDEERERELREFDYELSLAMPDE